MDVNQVYDLSKWYTQYVPPVLKQYNALIKVLDHNATQPSKQEVLPTLETLERSQRALPLDELPTDELNKLEKLEVLQYLGQQGIDYANKTVRTGEWDAATAAAEIKNAQGALNQRLSQFGELKNVLSTLEFSEREDEEFFEDEALVRVRFQGDADITNVTLLKKWSSDWYEIGRGVSMAVGEKPEEVRVIGAHRGSLVFSLATLASVALVLAIIAKRASFIAREYISIQNDIEDLRHKKRLNAIIEEQLVGQQEKIQDDGVAATMDELSTKLGKKISGELENVLNKAIEKYFEFYKKGGEVDITPAAVEYDPETDTEELTPEEERFIEQGKNNQELKSVVEEIRQQKIELKQLRLQLEDKRDDN